MEKSIHPPRKRITHIGNTLDIQSESAPKDKFGCDLVDSIIESMGTSIKAINSGQTSESNNKIDSLNQSTNKATSSFTDSFTDSLNAAKVNDAKIKKLTSSRKFPLMEKSQKILKQLKHNRSIPKPRAHLASAELEKANKIRSVSPTPKLWHNRKKIVKENENVVKPNFTLSKNINPKTPILNSNLERCNEQKSAIKILNADRNASVNYSEPQPVAVRTHSVPQGYAEKNKNDCVQANDTTDSEEYEKFIQNNTSMVKKKTKKRKDAKPNKRSVKIKHNNQLEELVEQTDSNLCNDSSEGSGKDGYKNVKPKHKNVSINETKKKKEAPRKVLLRNKKTKQLKKRDSDVTEHHNSNFDNLSSDSASDSENKVTGLKQLRSNTSSSTKKKIQTRSACLENKDKKAKELQRTSSLESLVDLYDSKIYDSSSDSESFNDNTIDSNHAKSNLSAKDKIKNSSATFKDADNSKITTEAVVESRLSFQKEHFTLNRYSLRSKTNNSGKLSNVEISNREECSLSNSDFPFPLEDSDMQEKDSHSNTSVVADATNIISINNSVQEPQNSGRKLNLSDSSNSVSQTCLLQTNEECKVPSTDGVVQKYVNTDFIPFVEFSASENINVVEQTQEDESDIEIIEVIDRKIKVHELGSPAYNSLDFKEPVRVDGNKMDVNSSHVSNTVSHSQASVEIVKSIKCEIEPLASDGGGRVKDVVCSPEVCFSRELVKEEIAEKHDPVYMTDICRDSEGNETDAGDNSIPSSADTTRVLLESNKSDRCVRKSFGGSSSTITHNETLKNKFEDDDDIMIIDPNCEELNIKQEKQEVDDDIIIEYEKKALSNENTVINPVTCLNSKRKNEYSLGHLEKNIRSEYPLGCKIRKMSSDQINSTLIEKELSLFNADPHTSNQVQEELSIKTSNRSKFQDLLSRYKKEFNVYQKIIQTEASVEAGLRVVEAHQAQKLQDIRSIIEMLVKSDPCFDKIYNETVKGKEQNSSPICVELNSSETEKLKDNLLPKSLPEVSSENSLSSKPEIIDNTISTNGPLTFIKIENDVKPDVLRLNVSPFSIADHSNLICKTEIVTEGTSEISPDEPVDEKPKLSFLGQKCNACGKDAVAACQRCAKVFFCSNICGRQFWNDGHKNECSV